MTALRFLKEELAALESRGLLRVARPLDPRVMALCSNDYLGYAARPLVHDGAAGGAGASALIAGYGASHGAAEAALAAWVARPSALLFTSGYAANVGTLAALLGPQDLVVSDELNHASIIDGSRLSNATIRVFPHRDLLKAEALLREGRSGHRRALLVSESYFSMDGTVADLRGLRAIADAHDATLMVDEAHALGVFGPQGRGLCAREEIVPDVLVGTLGKAVGLQGAFVAGAEPLRQFLWNRARSFVFSTALSPALAAAIPARVQEVRAADAARARLLAMAERIRGVLLEHGVVPGGEGPIVSWTVGTPERALDLQARLREHGLWVAAIRPPTVPPGTCRLRITPSAGLSDSELDRVLVSLAAVAGTPLGG
ncbi:MAG: aminotransferase class I/II-fold pyridoxal phosphate-dependent enzyme [Polyangiaceae bacterium]|jgi:8-amino-7-oxononanoate synthase|nr:aminotransferase class I/II-fold pyridoxal phosphate-dependent enzyme [Polyangiaceae bacterium]MBK8938325.1 aminotransferase class I/II-fold pyridoxal phosphate-dependent enzyme [Polyangiaceae bacterium]